MNKKKSVRKWLAETGTRIKQGYGRICFVYGRSHKADFSEIRKESLFVIPAAVITGCFCAVEAAGITFLVRYLSGLLSAL